MLPRHTSTNPVCVCLVLLSLFSITLAAQQNEVTTLAPGTPVTPSIKGGEPQLFKVPMDAGRYARINIQRKGVDLIVTVTSPDGKTTKHENAAGPQSPMNVSLIATAMGTYTIEVQTVDKWAAAGAYQILIDNVRSFTPLDEKRFNAERKVAEARSKQFIDTSDSRLEAIAIYQDSLVLWRELGDVVEEANTLQFLAETYKLQGNLTKCIENYTEALKLRGEEDRQARAHTLLSLADTYLDAKDSEKAITHYQQALEIFNATNNRRGEATARYGLGLTKARMFLMPDALTEYNKALLIYVDPDTRDRHEEARTAHAMGGALDVMGEPQEAQKYFEQALPAWRDTGDLSREGNTYSSLAKLEMDRGNWQLAFDTYDKAFDLYKRAEMTAGRDVSAMRSRRATTLYGLSYTYAALGDYARAFEILDQSLALRTPGSKGSTLMLIGYFHALEGKPEKAFEFFDKALLEQEPATDRRRSETYTAKGAAYAMLNRHEQALELYDKALAIQTDRDAPQRQAEAITQGWRGESLAALGRHEEALASYERAKTLWGKFNEPNGVALTLIGMARVERARNHLDVALDHVTKAINIIEPLRINVTSEALRTSYFATKVDYYELYIDLRMRLGLTAAAFETSERARARSMLETLARARVGGELKLDQNLAALVSKYRRVQRQIRSTKLEDQPGASSRLETERNQIETELRAKYPRYAALMYPQPLTTAEVQKLLDPDTLLLEFALGEERSYVWAVTATDIHGYVLPRRSQIEESARGLMKNLTSGQPVARESAAERKSRMSRAEAEYWQNATAFSRMLLGQVSSLAKKKNVVIVADGELQYFPFATLPAPDSQKALVIDHQVSSLPSASVLAVLRESPSREQPSKSVAVFADPVFEKDDPRIQLAYKNRPITQSERRNPLRQAWRDVTDSDAKLPRLPASSREAQGIVNLVPRDSSLKATGFQANRAMATSKELRLYRAVHFATHGILDEANPERSGVVLSLYDEQGRFHEDGYLRLKDIYDLDLPIELVVLSACRTGLGKAVKGEGIIGLARGFMYAGTRRVLASLWKVDDDATAELMRRFYEKMLKEGMTPAAALRAAQSSMSTDSQWSHPYFWAGFILQGEPK